jgi:hypothetical protein
MVGRMRSGLARLQHWIAALDRAACADLTGIEPAPVSQSLLERQWRGAGCILMGSAHKNSDVAPEASQQRIAFWSAY